MLNGTLRYCSHIRCFNPVIAVTNNGVLEAVTLFGSLRNYSNKGGCCKDIAPTQGKKVEPWPKTDPMASAWRPECPCEPQPPNYDPYRIKVPDVVVPPLPPSNAKETASDPKDLFKTSAAFENTANSMLDLFHNSPVLHPDYWRENEKLPSAPQDVQGSLPRLGYHGKNKYKYAFHEPWKPLDRLTLLSQAEKEELEYQKQELESGELTETEKC